MEFITKYDADASKMVLPELDVETCTKCGPEVIGVYRLFASVFNNISGSVNLTQ
jgi:hypothetical protein